MSKKKQSIASSDDGFQALIDSYTYALEDNSELIADMLEELSKRKLTAADKNSLKEIDRDLKSLDRQLNKLGK